MKKKGYIKRIFALASAAALLLSLAACGKEQQEEIPQGFLYVPEFMDLTVKEGEQNISNPVLRGGDLYYSSHFWNEETQESSQKFYRRNLETGETVELPLDLTIEGADYVYPTNGLSFDQENNMISLLNASITDEEGNYSQKYFLLKFDPEGKELLREDITEALKLEDSDNGYVQNAVIDNEGRLYVHVSGSGIRSGNAFVIVLDKDAKLLAKIDTGSEWVNSMGVTADGKVLITRHGSGVGMECVELDLAQKAMGTVHSGMPSSYNSGALTPAPEGGLLVNDGSKLWKYDLETGTAEEILIWTDCDINGSYIQMIQPLEDGRIAVYSENWSNGNNSKEIAFLTKKEASEIPQKKIITLATMYSDQNIQ